MSDKQFDKFLERRDFESPHERDRVNNNLLAGEADKVFSPTKDPVFMAWFEDSMLPWANMGLIYKAWLAGRDSVVLRVK